jgi:hypothetical protein
LRVGGAAAVGEAAAAGAWRRRRIAAASGRPARRRGWRAEVFAADALAPAPPARRPCACSIMGEWDGVWDGGARAPRGKRGGLRRALLSSRTPRRREEIAASRGAGCDARDAGVVDEGVMKVCVDRAD